MGWDTVVGIATHYGLDGPGFDTWREHILHSSKPVLESNQPPCKIVIGLFPRLKRSSRVVHHPSPFNTQDKERVELYLYLPSVLSWRVIGLALPFEHY